MNEIEKLKIQIYDVSHEIDRLQKIQTQLENQIVIIQEMQRIAAAKENTDEPDQHHDD